MPEVVQDGTVAETNPVKVEKINGAAKTEEVKENGSSADEKVAKNGHAESVKVEKEQPAEDNGNPDNTDKLPEAPNSSVESKDSALIGKPNECDSSDKPGVDEKKETEVTAEATDASKDKVDDVNEVKQSDKVDSKDNVETCNKVETCDKEEASNQVETTDKVDSTDKVETTDKVDLIDEVESVKEPEVADKVEVVDKVDSSEPVKKSEETDSKEDASSEKSSIEQVSEVKECSVKDKVSTSENSTSDIVDSSDSLVGNKSEPKSESMDTEAVSESEDKVNESSSVTDSSTDMRVTESSLETSVEAQTNSKTSTVVSSGGNLDTTEKPVEEPCKDVSSSNEKNDDNIVNSDAKKEETNDQEKQMEVDSSGDGKEVKEKISKESKLPEAKSESKLSDSTPAPSGSKGTEMPEEIDSMITEGRACMAKNNYNGAADLLGQACEKLREMFGELDDRCANCYYYYGSAMLECAKTENSVLGEGVNKEESESEEEEIPVVKDKEEIDDKEKKEVPEDKEVGEKPKDQEDGKETDKVNGEASGEVVPQTDEPMETDEKESDPEETDAKEEITDITLNKEEEEEEDTTLKAAWETLELAKFIFERQNNVKMLADTYLKLGEVAVESGHKAGIDDMKKCLELRSKFYGDNHRAIAETHFNIGLSYSLFEMFDEAIEEFDTSKTLLSKRIEFLEKTPDSEENKTEINEIKSLLPDIDEKIKDMKESKDEKAKADNTLKKKEEDGEGGSSSSGDKAVSNLNHLVKRKRKIEEVAEGLPEKDAKQACVEK